MAGFRCLAQKVRDPRIVTPQRRTALRKCVEKFAPYGHRATWDHLCARVGIGPEDRYPEPARLVAALAELSEARTVWLAYDAEFAARRKREKLRGLRRPSALDNWHRCTWGGCGVAWCDDPLRHPVLPLPEAMRRLVAALRSEPGAACPVCSRQDALVWRPGLRHQPDGGPVCTGCGIAVPEPVLTAEAVAAARRRERWAALV
ncbi:hypothetical protein ACH429_11160 [Streptomyces pathocidini]|uniref:Uncharacterized protein n=1 Tax=Streptomyces pathocidini TaxID=1650571 RepID=A0ABW7UPU1_9ACTN|nr:hypothetical protein [Streptomyces pathocidini]